MSRAAALGGGLVLSQRVEREGEGQDLVCELQQECSFTSCAGHGDCTDAHSLGLVDANTLQAGYAAAAAVIEHAEAKSWRGRELARRPLVDA